MTTAALIAAAGRGTRASGTEPKQYARVGGEAVLTRALRAFAAHPAIGPIQVVIHPGDRPHYDSAVQLFAGRLLPAVLGCETRQGSVRNGLEALARIGPPPDKVLIHDAARPFVSAEIVTGVAAALERHSGAVAAHPLADTLKQARADGTIAATFDRRGLFRAQTPQGFHFAAILAAHRAAQQAARCDFTDDSSLAEWAGVDVVLAPGSPDNDKLTTAEDLRRAELWARAAEPLHEVRTGLGFDVHRFAAGDHVWLCGVRIAHTHRLEGHSDADAGLHALTDAVLGALGDGDIGQHFPPSDERWKDASSHVFLADAAARVRARGGHISNVDVTLLCEAPKIAPHRAPMCARIAAILGIAASRVGVKATTTERLGFTGRREGIAAMAVATVVLPAR